MIVDAELTIAEGCAERATAIAMLKRLHPMARRRTVAADKAYDAKGFVAGIRALGFTPIAQNTKTSAIDGRTTQLCADLCDGWFPMHFTPQRWPQWRPHVEAGFARAAGDGRPRAGTTSRSNPWWQ